MALKKSQIRAIKAKQNGAGITGLTGYNVKTKRKEVIKDPRRVTFKNGRKAIQGIGSDGTKLTRFIKG